MASWQVLEDYVRSIASLRFRSPCQAEHLAGVDFDGVARPSDDEIIIVEVTENITTAKVREDTLKVGQVRVSLLQQGIACRAFLITDEDPTPAMVEAGRTAHVRVESLSTFQNEFFDYPAYCRVRREQPFGSAIDAQTGKNDSRKYVNVNFLEKGINRQFDATKIARELASGAKIVLVGDYGTGKSRLIREIFEQTSQRCREIGAFPLAINLRNHWGSSNFQEIVAGHLSSLGLSTSIDNAISLLNAGRLMLLLDGFDEIGAQTHEGHAIDQKTLRRNALAGIRDLISQCPGKVLVTGRSHYFDDDGEMYTALGVNAAHPDNRLLEAPSEFTDTEARAYLSDLGISLPTPEWLPKKPLIFQIAAELAQADLTKILEAPSGPFEFWGIFIGAVTRREAKGVRDSISSITIRAILHELAGISRESASFLGVFTPSDISLAYQKAVGTLPDSVGQQLLARMCTIGRIGPESPSRQFLDENIADVLRAEHLLNKIGSHETEYLFRKWEQPLRSVGIVHLTNSVRHYSMEQQCFALLAKHGDSPNKIAVGELVSLLTACTTGDIDFHGLQLSHATFPLIRIGARKVRNLRISSSIIEALILDGATSASSEHFQIEDSVVTFVFGISSLIGLPQWIKDTEIVTFADSVNNSSLIKESHLPAGQKLLLSVIHKIFFQRGSGREESALYKGGFGLKFDKDLIEKILKKLLAEGLISRHKGDDGWIYAPERRYTERMNKIRSELGLSDDSLWEWARSLE